MNVIKFMAQSVLSQAFLLSFVFISLSHANSQEKINPSIIQQQLQAIEQQKNRDEKIAKEQIPEPSVFLNSTTIQNLSDPIKYKSKEIDSPCFDINEIYLDGKLAEKFSFALSDIRFGEASYLNQCLGINKINEIVSKIQNKIIDRGYATTRVLVPQQNLKKGYLRLQLIVGRVGQVVAKGKDLGQQHFADQLFLKEGELLDIRDLEQGLENLKRIPSSTVDFKITPSEDHSTPGYSDIIVDRVKTAKPYRLSFSVDDSGPKSTGKYQGNATFAVDNLLGLNDILYLGYNQDLGGKLPGKRGTQGYNIGYSLPLGYWQYEASLSQYDYFQNPNDVVEYSGDSRNIAFDTSRVLSRDSNSKTKLKFGLWQKQTRNYVNGTLIDVQHRNTGGWHMEFSHDQKIGNTTLAASLDYRKPTGAFDARPAPEELFGEGSSRVGVYSAKLDVSTAKNIFNHPVYLYFKLKSQLAVDSLTPSDRITIGGRYTVRGFDGSRTLSGDQGWLLRNEVSTPFGQSPLLLYMALDAGSVYMKKREHENNPLAGNYLPANNLVGAALGFKMHAHNLAFDIFWGYPITQPDHFGPDKEWASGFSIGYQIN